MTARRGALRAALLACLTAGGTAAAARDPFAPPAAVPFAEERTPLQRIELGRLRLVAVVSDTPVLRALLEDETGLGYIVTIGTPVGPRGGVVVGMGRGWLRILEPGDGSGEQRPSAVVLEMSRTAGGRR
jgi:Tfp pilus assembly protein PilP